MPFATLIRSPPAHPALSRTARAALKHKLFSFQGIDGSSPDSSMPLGCASKISSSQRRPAGRRFRCHGTRPPAGAARRVEIDLAAARLESWPFREMNRDGSGPDLITIPVRLPEFSPQGESMNFLIFRRPMVGYHNQSWYMFDAIGAQNTSGEWSAMRSRKRNGPIRSI